VTQSDKTERYKKRMQQRKAIVDERIAKADEDRGVVILLTGNGKGKTSSGFGTVLRTLGHGYQAAVVQFIKGTWESGELNVLRQHPALEYYAMATGFTWETQNAEADRAAAQQVWDACKHVFEDPEIELVFLDELTYMLNFKYLDKDEVLEAIRRRPKNQSVIISGRGAKPYLTELADTVSEVKSIKHAFDAGIMARKGVEW